VPTLMRKGKRFSAVAILSLLAILLVAVAPFDAGAQSDSASVSGRVTDQQNAVIPNVEVEMKNVDTGLTQITKTNGDGIYTYTSLRPGNYIMSVRKEQFQTVSVTGITLHVQDSLSRNFALQIGSSAVSVTVEANGINMNTTDAAVSTVVDRQFAENLPLNGRSFQTLIYLTPGVVVANSSFADSGQFSVNGQRAASNYWTVDGVSANIGVGVAASPGNGLGGTLGSFSALGGTNSLVSVDALQEFRIQTSTYAPEFGRTPGGQVAIVTRSGTNDFHGTAFDYIRNDLLDANNWFANSVGLEKPRERQNDFGGTFGGPIVTNKTFFFFSYEGLRLRLPQTSLTNVPDLSARAEATPGMQPYLKAFPLPNGADNTATGIAQLNASYSNPGSLDAYSLRVDHRLNGSWAFFGRYNYSPSSFLSRGTSDGFAALSDVEQTRIVTQTGTAGLAWTISPVAVADLRFNYSHVRADGSSYLDGFEGAIPLSSLPFPDSFTSKDGLFNMFIFSLGQGEQLFVGKNTEIVQRQINLVGSLSWQRGDHSLKFGGDYRRLSPLDSPAEYRQSPFFSSVLDAVTGTTRNGHLGSATDVTLLFRNVSLYAQDTWRISPKLTVTYGLRWDTDFAPASENGPGIPAVTGYDLVDFSSLGFASPGAPPFHTTYDNFAPRAGVACQLSKSERWQRVVRGGFGIFYDLASAETGNLLANGTPPFGATKNLPASVFPFAPAQIAPVPIPSTGLISQLNAFNPSLKLPYTLQWNFAFEQALGKAQTVSVSYIGAKGSRLLQTTEVFNPPDNPALSGGLIDNTAKSRYDALQVQFRRPVDSLGLQVLASYTWSHSLDDGSASSYGSTSNLAVPGANGINWGDSDFDIRNSFTAGLTYQFPSPKREHYATQLIKGWSSDLFVIVRSAPPVDVEDTNFFLLESQFNTNVRPDIVPGLPLYLFGSGYPGGRALNPAALSDPPVDPNTGNPTRQGTLGRNTLRGFGATQFDVAIHRDFPIREGIKLQFRSELFNILNHPNFGPPNAQFGGTGFGLSTQTLAQSLGANLGGGGFSPLYQIGGPRSVQFALKLFF
jgi:Carboxypeptidase regulatory-like domain/TonB dependent receptor